MKAPNGTVPFKPVSAECQIGSVNRAGSSGFSLIELLVVVAIILVIAGFAIPTMTTTLDGVRLRGALGSATNIAQRCRMMAVKRNQFQRLHFSTSGNRVVLFVTDGTDTQSVTAPKNGDPLLWSQMWLPGEFSIPGLPPTQLTTVKMWGSSGVQLNSNVDSGFNSRGLPCLIAGTTCTPNGGFVYYYRYKGVGNTRWAATSISPAGRIESWLLAGTTWSN